jgi:hypothetical protein
MNQFSSYPADMATALIKQWRQRDLPAESLPDSTSLTTLFDVSYQATLLREEDNPVRCRIIYASPDQLQTLRSVQSRPHVLPFSQPAELTAHNLRKLSAAADFYRAILAVDSDAYGRVVIWGIVVTGTDWVNRVEGSNFDGVPLPPNLVVQALGPGHLTSNRNSLSSNQPIRRAPSIVRPTDSSMDPTRRSQSSCHKMATCGSSLTTTTS